MKVLLVGGGAREHAIARAIRRRPEAKLVVVAKNRNPGLEALADQFHQLDETNPERVVASAQAARAEVAAIGPEAPLAAGVSDALRRAGIPVAAPSQAAAEIETSKLFMRRLLKKHRVPGTIGFDYVEDAASARPILKEGGLRFAIKPVGLTGGKGVRVYGDHFRDLQGAMAYVEEVLKNRIGGAGVLLEELVEGEEFTVQAFCDGTRVVPTVAVQDHKRLLDNDQGPNTGGMGSYSQADGLLPFLPRAAWDESLHILEKIVQALRAEGRPYTGPIYGQFMLTTAGPRVIEVNARLGDPEAINVLSLFESDYVGLLSAMAEGTLDATLARFDSDATVVKYVVPPGYGTRPKAGVTIEVDEAAIDRAGAEVYYASVDAAGPGRVKTTPSRALAILGRGETIREANDACEAGLKHVRGPGVLVRHDIGTHHLIAQRIEHMKALLKAA